MAHPPLEIFTQRVRGSISAGLNVSPPMGSSEMAGQSGLCSLVSLEGCEDDDMSVEVCVSGAYRRPGSRFAGRSVAGCVFSSRGSTAGSARWLSCATCCVRRLLPLAGSHAQVPRGGEQTATAAEPDGS